MTCDRRNRRGFLCSADILNHKNKMIWYASCTLVEWLDLSKRYYQASTYGESPPRLWGLCCDSVLGWSRPSNCDRTKGRRSGSGSAKMPRYLESWASGSVYRPMHSLISSKTAHMSMFDLLRFKVGRPIRGSQDWKSQSLNLRTVAQFFPHSEQLSQNQHWLGIYLIDSGIA